jgi:hypothetical protein
MSERDANATPKDTTLLFLSKQIPKLTASNFADFDRLLFKHITTLGKAHDWLKSGVQPDYISAEISHSDRN